VPLFIRAAVARVQAAVVIMAVITVVVAVL
jgi:hypothetical protein